MNTSIDLGIGTITHRGIVCIDTFPLELVWGKSSTVLECPNCLDYATFKNVLIGLCKNCALYSYNGKYGNGFFNFPYSDINNTEISFCFGNIHPLNIINIEGVEYPQNALNDYESYSIYNLSLSSINELSLLLLEPFNIYGLYEFQKNYNCEIEVLNILIDKIKEHKLTYNIWSKNYYNKCLTIEKFYKVSEEDYKIQQEIKNNTINNKNLTKYPCHYCSTYKLKYDLKKCGQCGIVRYCSVACQIRDWKDKHELECEQQDLENPARKNSEQDLENPENTNSAFESDDNDNDVDFFSNDTVETDIDDID